MDLGKRTFTLQKGISTTGHFPEWNGGLSPGIHPSGLSPAHPTPFTTGHKQPNTKYVLSLHEYTSAFL